MIDSRVTWVGYDQAVGDSVHKTVEEAVACLARFERTKMLDLGAGNCRHARYCLRTGFKDADAVDISPRSQQYASPRLVVHTMPIEEFVPRDGVRYGLCVAWNVFPFLSGRAIMRVVEMVYGCLESDGAFVCNFLRVDDPWVIEKKPGAQAVGEKGLVRLGQGFEVLATYTRDYTGGGFKKWCTREVIWIKK